MTLLQSIEKLMSAGGPIMWLLLGCCLLIWFLLAYRALQARAHRFVAPDALCALAGAARAGDHAAASQVRGAQRAMLEAAARPKPEEVEQALEIAVRTGMAKIAPPRDVTRCLIKIAPLLGLFGTVSGMIQVFAAIRLVGTSEPALLAGGISQALLTTQLGLLIAVPGLYGEGRLRRWEERLLHRLEESYLVLLQWIRETAAAPAGDSGEPGS